MAITITDRTQIRETVPPAQVFPAVAGGAMTNPGPVAATTGVVSSGNGVVGHAIADAGRLAYLGYMVQSNVDAGRGVSVMRGVIVDGFTGCVAGSAVYVDATGPDASGTASGLTHTAPTTPANGLAPIGVALTTTKILFH